MQLDAYVEAPEESDGELDQDKPSRRAGAAGAAAGATAGKGRSTNNDDSDEDSDDDDDEEDDEEEDEAGDEEDEAAAVALADARAAPPSAVLAGPGLALARPAGTVRSSRNTRHALTGPDPAPLSMQCVALSGGCWCAADISGCVTGRCRPCNGSGSRRRRLHGRGHDRPCRGPAGRRCGRHNNAFPAQQCGVQGDPALQRPHRQRLPARHARATD